MKGLILFLLLPLVIAQEIELKHIGYGEDQSAILISLTNIGNEFIENPDIYLDGNFKQTMNIKIKPGTSISFFVFADSGNHTIDVVYNGKNYTLNVANSIVVLPEEKQQKQINKWFLFLIIITPLLITIYLLIRRQKLV